MRTDQRERERGGWGSGTLARQGWAACSGGAPPLPCARRAVVSGVSHLLPRLDLFPQLKQLLTGARRKAKGAATVSREAASARCPAPATRGGALKARAPSSQLQLMLTPWLWTRSQAGAFPHHPLSAQPHDPKCALATLLPPQLHSLLQQHAMVLRLSDPAVWLRRHDAVEAAQSSCNWQQQPRAVMSCRLRT